MFLLICESGKCPCSQKKRQTFRTAGRSFSNLTSSSISPGRARVADAKCCDLGHARDRFSGGARAASAAPYAQARADLQDMTAFLATLEPTTDRQKQIIAEAMPIFVQIVETTLLMTRRLANRAIAPPGS
jgi:hypothetical protein